MNITISLLATLLLLTSQSTLLQAAPDTSYTTTQQGSPSLRYKMISGYKQPFDDDLQLHFSKGWTPVGGVSVTSWNNALFFAQLLSKPTSSQ
jgi:hypothetical protein